VQATLRREPPAEPGEPWRGHRCATIRIDHQCLDRAGEDILEDGVNGWFVDRDPESIAKRLRELHDDPELRISMGRRARQASLRFTWAGVVASYEELYASVAG
jgi:hypothetical protein